MNASFSASQSQPPRRHRPEKVFSPRIALGVLAALSMCSSGCKMLIDPAVRINQHGYLPLAKKIAIVRSDAPTAQNFQLLNADGEAVFSGQTLVRPGIDDESGHTVHWADFSDYSQSGKKFRIEVDDDASYPFAIDSEIYSGLRRASLNYFYHNRSGTPVEIPWAGSWKWTHPAGHLSDANVTCIGGCDYTLNALGGWYDAGDHGKYVVNGGISLWTLFNLYERTAAFGKGTEPLAALGDGSLAIPENSNSIPDLLDEARWEMDFLLRMQVPQGQEKAGMVHHKLHDTSWSTLGMAPPEYFKERYLHPPSTAATLNLAATGAQCFRIFKDLDPSFAERCRLGAIRAWNAAQKFPDIYAPQYSSHGGGPYDDTDVSDERYWAAVELYLSFKTDSLRQNVESSPHHGLFPKTTGHEKVQHFTSMTWQSTAALGAISLLTVPNALPEEEHDQLVSQLKLTADSYLQLIEAQGYRVPLKVGSNGEYPWGSNSLVANNALILALAFDLTHESKYLDGVGEGMNYLLGRNPLNFSYVSGFGSRFLKNPHHRFWAHQAISRFPGPPPGALAGGPNSRKQDPTAGRLGDCPPQRCYVDHVQAWSVNEVAINWNAPLAWLAVFLDETGRAAATEQP